MLTTILQLLVSGIAMGFIYSLVGVEYTLIWNSTGLLNFSHDKLITTGAYMFGGTFVLALGFPTLISIVPTLIVMALFGVLMAFGIFNPLRKMSSMIFAVMGTILFGKIIYEAIRLIYGPIPFGVSGFLTGTVQVGDIALASAYLYIIAVSIAIVIILQSFLKFTRTGKAVRCVAQNKEAATLMGINVTRNISVTTGISAAICGIIGILVIPLFSIDVNMSNMISLKGFAAGIVGGFGYIPGAILGGLIIGIMENIAVMVVPSVYKDVVAFVLLIAFLLFRPGGILRNRA